MADIRRKEESNFKEVPDMKLTRKEGKKTASICRCFGWLVWFKNVQCVKEITVDLLNALTSSICTRTSNISLTKLLHLYLCTIYLFTYIFFLQGILPQHQK